MIPQASEKRNPERGMGKLDLMDRNHRAQIIWRAERLERATKSKGCVNGDLGLTGLALLRILLFRFGDCPTPSYKALRRASGLCIDTISKALKRLAAAGLISIERRWHRTRLGPRRLTNQYGFPAQLSLILPRGEPRKPIERKFLTARFVPFAELRGHLRDALDALAARVAEKDAHEGSDAMIVR
jgi:hypothetical protein